MTNKELQEKLKQYPDDLPVGVFCQYECSQYGGAILNVEDVEEDYLGDVDHPTSEKCLLVTT